MKKKIFIVTGEYSGDLHASKIVKYLLEKNDDFEIEAIGGQNLQNSGVKLFGGHEKMQVIGGFNFKMIYDHLTLAFRLVNYLKNDFKPDLVLLVDYGGFNLNISKLLKKHGFSIYYYIPPQIWASRKWRLNTVKKNIDKVLTIMPFENEMYEQIGVKTQFTGHPIVHHLPEHSVRKDFFDKYGLDKTKKLVSIFPGSRVFEINHLLPVFLDSAEKIKQKYGENAVQFVICQAPNIKDDFLNGFLKRTGSDIKVIKDENYALLSISDALILASGTVALEAALYQTPMIIAYKGPLLVYLIVKAMMCVKKVSLPNIITKKDIVPELLQFDATAENICDEILKFLQDEEYTKLTREALGEVKNLLTDKNSAKEAAQAIAEYFSTSH